MSSVISDPSSPETLDSVCGVQIFQRENGYRFNLDPILLADFARQSAGRVPTGRTVDLGSGSGIIALILAKKWGWTGLTALEIQSALHALARRNVELNGLVDRVNPMQGDLRQVKNLLPQGGFSHLVCNPPYRPVQRGRVAPHPEWATANHEVSCALSDVVEAAKYLLLARGAFHLVFPVARLEELLELLAKAGFAAQRIRHVHPRHDRPSRVFLLTALKGAKSPLVALPPLVLHRPGAQGYSEEVEAMLGAGIPSTG